MTLDEHCAAMFADAADTLPADPMPPIPSLHANSYNYRTGYWEDVIS
jgi:hypothetical protein